MIPKDNNCWFPTQISYLVFLTQPGTKRKAREEEMGEEGEEEAERRAQELAVKVMSTEGKLSHLNKLYKIRCQYEAKTYEQGRKQGKFESLPLGQMQASSIMRYYLKHYNVIYQCSCEKEYHVANSVVTHINRNNCDVGIFKKR